MVNITSTEHTTLTPKAAAALRHQWLTESKQSQFAAFTPESLAWLLLPPVWTLELAQACAFPFTGFDSLLDWLDSAEQAGLCEHGFASEQGAPKETYCFWLSKTARPDLREHLRETLGADALCDQTASIVAQVDSVASNPIWKPSVLWDWLEPARLLGGNQGSSAAAQWLKITVQRDASAEQIGAARDAIETCESLADIVGGELAEAVYFGRNHLDLAFRVAQDRRHLAHFITRDDQIQTYTELLLPDNASWALHYLGMGGIGKTMLIRYLTTSTEFDVITARIDFDYLSPDYPTRRPMQLLMALADSLRVHITTSAQQRHFAQSADSMDTLEEAIQARDAYSQMRQSLSSNAAGDSVLLSEPNGNGGTEASPLPALQRSEFQSVLRSFAALLRSLERPVVFFLDTCEELTKMQPAGATSPQVEAAFQILEALHEQVLSLRVVFSGRRLLAQAGADWEIPPNTLAEGQTVLPKEKTYLRLHLLRGFDAAEADRLFARYEDLALDADTRMVMLSRSPEAGPPLRVVWKSPPAVGQANFSLPPTMSDAIDVPRYNPWDLSLYADWLQQDAGAARESLKSGSADPYVRLRIVERLESQMLRDIAPVAVLLRRFDLPTLTAMLPVGGTGSTADDIQEAFRKLGEQEWTTAQRDTVRKNTVLEVNRNLLSRFETYYAQEQAETWQTLCSDLAPKLDALIRSTQLKNLSLDAVDAALRLLSAEAATLWDDLTQRLPEQAGWHWAQALTGRLLGEEGAVGAQNHPLRAAVLATQASAYLHESPGLNLVSTWREVERTVDAYPVATIAEWLRARAFAGRIAHDPIAVTSENIERFASYLTIPPETLTSLWHYKQLAAAQIAAMEALFDTWEGPDGMKGRNSLPGMDSIARVLQIALQSAAFVVQTVSRTLQSFGRLFLGRLLALEGNYSEAFDHLMEAENIALERPAHPSDGRDASLKGWADWRAPAFLLDRSRLELMRLPLPWLRGIEARFNGWQEQAKERLDVQDSERLLSRLLLYRLAHTAVPEDELTELTRSASRHLPRSSPACTAHRQTPPLFSTLALAWAGLGHSDEALNLMDTVAKWAGGGERDGSVLQEIDRTRLRVIRRQRLGEEARLLLARRTHSSETEALPLLWAAATVNGLPIPGASNLTAVFTPDLLHHWWICQPALRQQDSNEYYSVLWNHVEMQLGFRLTIGDNLTIAELLLDLFEVRRAAQRDSVLINKTLQLVDEWETQINDFDVNAWREQNPRQAEAAFEVALRQSVLMNKTLQPGEWERFLGPRGMAQKALEVGELMALRRPREAVRVLTIAYDCFQAVSDSFGQFCAAILASLCAGRMQDSAEARFWLFRALAGYEVIRSKNERMGLPEGDKPLQRSVSLQIQDLQYVSPHWKGWMARLLAGVAWSDSRSETLMTVRVWLESEFTLGTYPPLELDLGVSLQAAKSILPSGVGADAVASRGDLNDASASAAQAAYTAFVQRDVRFIIEPVEPLDNIPVSRLIAEDSIAVTLSFEAPGNAAGGETKFDTIRAVTPGVKPYSECQITDVNQIVSTLVDQWTGSSEPLRFQIEAHPSLACFAWEAFFASALPVESRASLRRDPPIWRGDKNQRTNTLPRNVPWNAAATQIFVAPEWRRAIENAWKPVSAKPVVSDDLLQWIADQASNQSSNQASKGTADPEVAPFFKIAHLVGTPLLTSVGMQWRIGMRVPHRSDAEEFSKRSKSSASGDPMDNELTPFGVEQAARLNAYLTILQAEPSETVTRFPSDREFANRLRCAASNVFVAGARRVLTLPSLPEQLATQALSALARGLAGHSVPSHAQLLEAVAEVREAILTGASSSTLSGDATIASRENLQELALDVCLFVRE